MNSRYLHNLPSPLPASPPSLRSPRRERGFNFLLPSGMGIYTIHQPNDSVGTVQSHRNTQRSFPPPIAVEGRLQRESSIDAGYLDSRLRGNDDLFEMCRYPCPPGGEAGGVVNVRWASGGSRSSERQALDGLAGFQRGCARGWSPVSIRARPA